MIIKDLVVTGLVKLIRHAKIDSLIVDQLNSVTKEEIDTLKGVKSNIQDQLTAIDEVVSAAKDEQETFKSGIANAINNIPRNPNTEQLSSSDSLEQFVNELGEIEHGPDVSGVTAEADDVTEGKKYVNKKGVLVTGTLHDYGYEPQAKSMMKWNSNLYMFTPGYVGGEGNPDIKQERCIITRGMYRPLSDFGNASAGDVLKGKTFTSSSGLKVTGTCTKDADTSDATATADKIVHGYSAYVKGKKIEGQIYPARDLYLPNNGGIEMITTRKYYVTGEDDMMGDFGEERKCIAIKFGNTDGDFIYPKVIDDPNARLIVSASKFGDVQPYEVLQGYTFTSTAGLNINGTMKSIRDYYCPFPDKMDDSIDPEDFGDDMHEVRFREGRTSYTNRDGQTVNIPSTNFVSVYYDGQFYTGSENAEIMIRADDFGNASAGDAVEGKTFTSVNGMRVKGALKKYGAINEPVSVATNTGGGESCLYIRIQPGAYVTNASQGYPEIRLLPNYYDMAVGTGWGWTSNQSYGANKSISTHSALKLKQMVSMIHNANKVARLVFKTFGTVESLLTINCTDGTVIDIDIVSIAIPKDATTASKTLVTKNGSGVTFSIQISDSGYDLTVVTPSWASIERRPMAVWLMWG